jgi:hypothetical protein
MTKNPSISSWTSLKKLVAGGVSLLAFPTLMACTMPGPVAPSTMPLGSDFVVLGSREAISSCGYTLLTIPLKNPRPLSTLIEEMQSSRGGDALIEVASDSSVFFYLFGVANCIEVRGKVVKISN